MPPMVSLERTVRGRHLFAKFSESQETFHGDPALPAYRQHDQHSCGFLAVLTVARYFDPVLTPYEVFRVVRPSTTTGCSRRRVLRSLDQLGIGAVYVDTLNMLSLWSFTSSGNPVIVTVMPPWADYDHWTVVRGVDLEMKRIYLTNCYNLCDQDSGMSFHEFASMWYDRGEGLVCRKEIT